MSETYPIGVLTSFTPTAHDREIQRVLELKLPPEGLRFDQPNTYTAKITKMWLHPSLRPLPWGTRNPPPEVLRAWWVYHLGKTNRSFKRTRLSQIRRLWRECEHNHRVRIRIQIQHGDW